jgi:FixJ family two-component response regulator
VCNEGFGFDVPCVEAGGQYLSIIDGGPQIRSSLPGHALAPQQPAGVDMTVVCAAYHDLRPYPMSLTPIVFVVDDDVSVRESLEALMRYAGYQAEMFASAREFLARPAAQVPNCLLLDVSLPDLNGLELQERIAADRGDMPIIFITGYGDIPTTVKAMKAGAVEFLTKPLSQDALLSAIKNALASSQMTLGQQAEKQALRDRYGSLSGREQEVMVLVTSGMMNKQVGGKLGISEITVKAHRGRVMRKMKARSLADLVRMAASLGLTSGGKGKA